MWNEYLLSTFLVFFFELASSRSPCIFTYPPKGIKENFHLVPVLSVIPFETEEDAIKIANDTSYGLTNYIQTQDPEKVKRVARKLRSGMVDVNGAGIAVDAPFGGFKHSGIGREAGEHGLEEFLEVKAVGGWS